MRPALCAIAVSVSVAAACSRPEPRPTRPVVTAEPPRAPQHAPVAAAPAAGPARRFGAYQPDAAPRARLSEILQAPDRFRDRAVQVEGTVVAVCQERGCWMEIRDEATQAHVRMHGHSFFVPRDVANRRARVLGTLVAAHPPTGCDNEAREATGNVAQLELDATGIQVD